MNKLFLMAVLIAIALSSCKKDSAPKPTCKIITVTLVPSGGGTTTYNYSYNSEGKLSTSSSGLYSTTFSYSGNTVIESNTHGGVFESKEIITLNANGLASNVKTENNETGTLWDNTVFEYSGTELIKSTDTNSAGDPVVVTTFTWSGGNLVSITTGSSTSTLVYYTDKPAQTGDYVSFLQLLFGFEIYRVKNAIKSSGEGSAITSYSYSYDTDGKIASMTVTGNSTSTFNYQYQCN